jgi:hypothetical protein
MPALMVSMDLLAESSANSIVYYLSCHQLVR